MNALGTAVADDAPPISRLLFTLGFYILGARYGAGFGESNSMTLNGLIMIKNDPVS
jgi:hypothetical protein